MDDASRVTIIDTVNDLADDVSGLHFAHRFNSLKIAEKFTTTRILHYHDHLLLFNESVVELYYVLVTQFLQVQCLLVDALNRIGVRY